MRADSSQIGLGDVGSKRSEVGQAGSRGIVRNANVAICGESDWLVGEGTGTAMKKRRLLLVGLACAVAEVVAGQGGGVAGGGDWRVRAENHGGVWCDVWGIPAQFFGV